MLSQRERSINLAFDQLRKCRRDMAALAVAFVELHLKAQGLEALTSHEAEVVRAACRCGYALPYGWPASERELAGVPTPAVDPDAIMRELARAANRAGVFGSFRGGNRAAAFEANYRAGAHSKRFLQAHEP